VPAIVWDDSLRTDIELIDGQHRELFERANRLFEAVGRGKNDKAVGEALQFLMGYVKRHFHAEEKFMRAHAYPKLSAHSWQHTDITQSLNDLVAQFKRGGDMWIAMKVSRLFSGWIVNHIRQSDMDYVRFIHRKK